MADILHTSSRTHTLAHSHNSLSHTHVFTHSHVFTHTHTHTHTLVCIHTPTHIHMHGWRFLCNCGRYIVPHKIENVPHTFGRFVSQLIIILYNKLK